MTHEIKQAAIDNFMMSMDITDSFENHIRNAMRDAVSYKWNDETLIKLIKEIKIKCESEKC